MVVMVPYWVSQSPSQGNFPKNTLSISCNGYEVDGDTNFGHGVLDLSRAHIVLYMGSFVEGVLHTSFLMKHFSNPFYFRSFFCGLNIKCYVQWKLNSTEIPLEVRNTLSAI
jgi:hypothetical protein